MNRFPNPLWRFTEKFTKTGKEMTRSISIMDDFAFSIIDRRVMEERSGGEKSTEREKKDLLGLLMGIRFVFSFSRVNFRLSEADLGMNTGTSLVSRSHDKT